MRQLLILAVLLTGCSGATATPAVLPVAPMHFAGSGEQNTAPFTLAAGDYDASWTATSTTGNECFMGVAIKSPTDAAVFQTVASTDVATSDSGKTTLYGFAAGMYYLAAMTHCAWTVDLTKR